MQRAAQRGKDVWITETQAAPWTNVAGFATDDLVMSALQYRGQGEATVLLWGMEQWLTSPTWLNTGLRAVRILRGG